MHKFGRHLLTVFLALLFCLLGACRSNHRIPAGEVVFEGNFDSYLGVTALPRESVRNLLSRSSELSLLPAEKVPSPLRGGEAGNHPVFFMLGNQQKVKPTANPAEEEAMGSLNYLEAMILVPYVEVEGCEGPLAALSILYLDQSLPTFLGWVTAFPKRIGHFKQVNASWPERPSEVEIRSLFLRRKMLEMTATSLGVTKLGKDFPPLRDLIAPVYDAPNVGRHLDIFRSNRFSFRDWILVNMNLDFDAAKVTPVSLELSSRWGILGRRVPNLSFPPMSENSPLGAIYLDDLSWILHPPRACSLSESENVNATK